MNILERLWFKVQAGASIEDLGEITEEVVISYKGLYISLLIDNDGRPKSLSWSNNPTMFNVPVREFWQAKAPGEQSNG